MEIGSNFRSCLNFLNMKQEEIEVKDLQEVMPSYFAKIASRESKPISDHKEIERLIKYDECVKWQTITYRKRLALGKKFADEYKPQTQGIAFSTQFNGHGKELKDVERIRPELALDFDGIQNPLMLNSLIKKAIQLSPYVKCEYITISGQGFRIIVSYSMENLESFDPITAHNIMYKKATQYFETLLGIKADHQCSDVTRIAGLAHDEDAYFNKDAELVKFTKDDLILYYANQLKLEQEASKKRSYTRRSKTSTSKKSKTGWSQEPPTMQDVLEPIQKRLELQDHHFEPGHHNDYVLHFGKHCVLYGINKDDAIQKAIELFGGDYPETASVMKQCYKKQEFFGVWHFFREGETYPSSPTIRMIRQWLSTHYDFRLNLVTGRYEVRSLIEKDDNFLKWTYIDDNIENSIWSAMGMDGMNVTVNKLHAIINSNFSEPIDPLEEYLRSLPDWDGKHDYIGDLADRVTVKYLPSYFHTHDLFKYFFRKWFVSMVVAWVEPQVVNQTMLILVGKGGIYKTTLLNYLLPPALRAYYANDSTAAYSDKDFMEANSSKALVLLDEFSTALGKSLSAFKSCVTKLTFSIRRPYDKYRSELPHRASLCATSNDRAIISDTENRRFLPWIVESIVSPYEKPLDYTHLYAQAVALGKQVEADKKEGKRDGWVYWLTADDIRMLRVHNVLFMTDNYAEEQILRYYDIPTADTDKSFIHFRSNAEIAERIGGNPALRQNISNQNIGTVMGRLGFKSVHRRKGNGWLVIEKDGAQINNESLYSPSDDREEEETHDDHSEKNDDRSENSDHRDENCDHHDK